VYQDRDFANDLKSEKGRSFKDGSLKKVIKAKLGMEQLYRIEKRPVPD
jgi:hypothetical protein